MLNDRDYNLAVQAALIQLSESRIFTDEGIPRKMESCRTLAAEGAGELEN